MSFSTARGDDTSRPRAIVYRGPAACDGCPEAVGHLLETSPQKFVVSYAGPDEDIEVTAQSLRSVQLYAQPGGPDLDSAWEELGDYAPIIRNFVSSGGYYLGFCLGAFLAGHTPGFAMLPKGADSDAENSNPNSQVTTGEDTVIQVDWTFVSGKTQENAWLYFQDGAVIKGLGSQGRVLGRYSKTGDVAASVTPFGKGWVGLVGPHPEATEDWYAAEDITNPDGVSLRYGYDFIAATLAHGKITSEPLDTASESIGSLNVNPLASLSRRVAKAFHGA